jgi:spermidine/putrescine transport system permease protein
MSRWTLAAGWLLGLALLYVPLAALLVSSFWVGPQWALAEPGTPVGWGFHWYRRVLSHPDVLQALGTSLLLGAGSSVLAAALGTGAAFALEGPPFPGKRALEALIEAPLLLPEIVLGLALLIWFSALRLALGGISLLLAHVTFCVPYVIITVRARLRGLDPSWVEAARDLGASPRQAFWRVSFPLAWPGILAGALMAFTLSFDDFLVSFFTAGPGTETLPMRVYAMVKFGITPEISAVSTLLTAATLLPLGALLLGMAPRKAAG